MPIDLAQLADLYRRLNKTVGNPTTPSNLDKKMLEYLEGLKVDDPLNTIYQAIQRQPQISGTPPERVVVEVRTTGTLTALTYWYYWRHDRFRGDHIDWEPLTMIY